MYVHFSNFPPSSSAVYQVVCQALQIFYESSICYMASFQQFSLKVEGREVTLAELGVMWGRKVSARLEQHIIKLGA